MTVVTGSYVIWVHLFHVIISRIILFCRSCPNDIIVLLITNYIKELATLLALICDPCKASNRFTSSIFSNLIMEINSCKISSTYFIVNVNLISMCSYEENVVCVY